MSTETLDVIRSRRTVRRFAEEQVSDDDLDTILEMAMYAPSRLNRRPWEFIIVRDPQVRKSMAEALRVHPYFEQASAVVVVCAKPGVTSTWLMDISAATENLLLAATALGLGTAWVGDPASVSWQPLEEQLRQLLDIPTDVRVGSLVAVGHPEEGHGNKPVSERYEPNRVHVNSWGQRR